MDIITKSYDSVADLTVFNVNGEVTFEDIWTQTCNFLCGSPSQLVLWDFTFGTVAPISNQEAESIAKRGSEMGATIEGGKAAILAPKSVDYGMSRVFQTFSEMKKIPLEIEVFRDMETARKWLIPDCYTISL